MRAAPSQIDSARAESPWQFAGPLSSLSNNEDIRLCFMNRSPKLFTLLSHCLRCGSHRLPRDAHAGCGSSLLIFGFRVLAPKERLLQSRLSIFFDKLHLYRVAIELCHASNEKVCFELRKPRIERD